MKLVSVVLPTYNGKKFLEQSVRSVLTQTYRNVELILVDDCSTDGTGELIDSLAKEDARIRVLRNERNQKLPRSLNRGFSEARGEYLTWTSDDNWYEPEAISQMVEYLDAHPNVGLVAADMRELFDDGRVITTDIRTDPSSLLLNTIGACFLYRSEVAHRVGQYNPDRFLVEDYEYWLRMGLVSRMGKIDKCLYNYRIHANGLTLSRTREILIANAQVKLEMLKKYAAMYPGIDCMAVLKSAVPVLKTAYRENGDFRCLQTVSSLGMLWRLKAAWWRIRRRMSGAGCSRTRKRR